MSVENKIERKHGVWRVVVKPDDSDEGEGGIPSILFEEGGWNDIGLAVDLGDEGGWQVVCDDGNFRPAEPEEEKLYDGIVNSHCSHADGGRGII
ncbi:hypothetical protein ACFL0Y_04430 [Patescibacteria group bacterium]